MKHDRRRSGWTAAAAVVLFIVHALNYLYFFVDDEAIPYVYAQNALHGKGLVYNALEGRVEGYSDFLHVGVATLILATVRTLHLPKVSVFFFGKSLSIASAIGVLLLAWWVLRRQRTHDGAAMTALAFLALAPPLAIWSCSSLETVPFALTLTVLVAALIADADGWAAAAAVLLVLERIDGFVFAGAFIGAFLLTGDAQRRRTILRNVVVPLGIACVVYHAWRFWYFGDVLPAPLESKILYKLKPHANLVVKAPDESYLHRFLAMYGWPAAGAIGVALAAAFRVGGLARRLAIGLVPLFAYVALVGDWMFGFRFFVPLLPPLALTIAVVLNPTAIRHPKLAAALAVVSTMYLGLSASRFVDTFRNTEKVETFLSSPSRDLHRFFWPYYSLYEAGRTLMRPGDVVAYNQAGFIPFMLDLNNIDDLGVCSRFYAELPTTDVYFTEVGRYAPLTNTSDLRAGQAYLLYDNTKFILSRTDILARANGDRIPPTLFGGYYQLVQLDADRQNAIYRRTSKGADTYRSDPRAFDENIAHVSYVRQAVIDGAPIAPGEYQTRLRFLNDQTTELSFAGRLDIAVEFAADDERVRSLAVENVRATQPAVLTITLSTRDGRIVHQTSVELEREKPIAVESAVPPDTMASRLDIHLTSRAGASVFIKDLRVQGQTPALEAYITRKLRFPAPSRQ